MSVEWTITAPGGGSVVSLEAVGLSAASGAFRTQAADVMQLRAKGKPFDTVTGWYAYDELVTLYRDGEAYFSGRVKNRPRRANGRGEELGLQLAGPWQDLEEITYHEGWLAGGGAGLATINTPFVVLGQNASGAYESTGATIAGVLAYAAAHGANLQVGTVDAGVVLWPSEERNIKCAEVIRKCLRFHPDWVTWCDHSTTPPTMHVRARASLDVLTLPVDGDRVEVVDLMDRADLQPQSVRITYLTSANVDGEIVRTVREDVAPEGGPTEGRGVVSAVVELAGVSMQFQKSRIQTREIAVDKVAAKAYLKAKFPQLKDVPDNAFAVLKWDRSLIEEADAHPDPINPRAERLSVETLDDVPNELVRGSIEDWMRKKIRKVKIDCKIIINPAASDANKELLKVLKKLKSLTIVATDATTKIYKGLSQWAATEDAPAGLAASIYNGLAALQYQGTITLVDADLPALRYHGKKIRITNTALGELTGLDGLISDVSWELESGRTTLTIGPAPHLSIQDTLELQRMMRSRPVKWYSTAERTSNLWGAENDPGSHGDCVNGYDAPETILEHEVDEPANAISPRRYELTGTTWKVIFHPCSATEHSLWEPGKLTRIKLGAGYLDDVEPPKLTLETGENVLWATIKLDKDSKLKADDPIVLSLTEPPDTQVLIPNYAPTTNGQDGIHRQKVGTFTVVDENEEPTWKPADNRVSAWLHVPGIKQLMFGEEGDDDASVAVFDGIEGGTKQVKLRGVKGENKADVQASWDALDAIYTGGGFTQREVKIQITPEVVDGIIVLKAKLKIPLPDGEEGNWIWQPCDGGTGIELHATKGVITSGTPGTFVAGCPITDSPGPS